jgi:hypothetical protein
LAKQINGFVYAIGQQNFIAFHSQESGGYLFHRLSLRIFCKVLGANPLQPTKHAGRAAVGVFIEVKA